MKKNYITAITSLLAVTVASAQVVPPPIPPPPPPGLPIDGGIALLISAGIAYGYKKLRKK